MDISINSVLGDIEWDVACQCLVGSDLAMGVASEREMSIESRSHLGIVTILKGELVPL